MSLSNLKKTLSAFLGTIETIYGDNLVLGGSHALKLHGLEFHREPSDVDLIIYRPTVTQAKFLELVQRNNGQKGDFLKNPDYRVRVTKFKSPNGRYSLDIIISEEETPKNLLSLNLLDIDFKIQSVENIVKAKASYLHKVDGRGSSKFISQKDAIDLQNLKSLNFNL